MIQLITQCNNSHIILVAKDSIIILNMNDFIPELATRQPRLKIVIC